MLILASEPARRHPATLRMFRGAEAHQFEWLKARLSERAIVLPSTVVRDLSGVNWWTTSLRYDPKVIRRRDAEDFLERVKRVIDWVRGRL